MTNALTRLLALLGISSPQALRAFLVGIASMYVAQKLFAAQPASRRRLAPVAADAVPAARAATGGAAKGGKAGAGGDDDEIEVDGSLDLRRQAAIAFGRASDHSGELLVVNSPTFDMNKTIFRNIEGFFPRAVMKARVRRTLKGLFCVRHTYNKGGSIRDWAEADAPGASGRKRLSLWSAMLWPVVVGHCHCPTPISFRVMAAKQPNC